MQIKVSKCFSLISPQKKGHRLFVAASMDVLPCGSSNFGHDLSQEGFSDFFHNFQTLPDPCLRVPGINVGTRRGLI